MSWPTVRYLTVRPERLAELTDRQPQAGRRAQVLTTPERLAARRSPPHVAVSAPERLSSSLMTRTSKRSCSTCDESVVQADLR
jgi:hypothetical protein